MKSKILFACCLISCCVSAQQSWKNAEPGYKYEFPRDHFSHPDYETEWWYYTGNLKAPDGHRYGFELTFFRQAQPLSSQLKQEESATWRPDQLYLAHLALSDIDGKSFYHTEKLNRAGPGLAGASLGDSRYWNGNWQVRWTSLPNANQELTAICDRFTLRLKLASLKAPVIQGQDGISRKSVAPGQASHYISLTRLQAAGQLDEKQSQTKLTGTAWMDHEFFTEPHTSDLVGWDWFAIQLGNQQELMLYRLRNKSGGADPYSSGTYIDSQGKQTFLAAGDFSLTPGDTWQSPHTGARYPVAWHIHVPSLDLDLTEETALKDQELWSKNSLAPSYWEGAVTYAGTMRGQPASGLGYLEMTGYKRAIQLGGMVRK